MSVISTSPPSLSRLLSLKAPSEARWSPDGKSLAFCRKEGNDYALMLRDPQGQLKKLHPGRVDSVRWINPDLILFGQDHDGDERRQLYLVHPSGGQAEKISSDDQAIYYLVRHTPQSLVYKSNERDPGQFEYYSYDLETRTAHPIEATDPGGSGPPSQDIVITKTSSNVNNNLYLFNLESGRQRLLTSHQGNATYDCQHHLDKQRLVVATNQDREFSAPCILDTRTGQLETLVDTHWDTEALALSKDRSELAYVLNEEGYSRLYLMDLKTRQTRNLPLADGVIGGLDWRQDGKLSLTLNSATRPTSVLVVDPGGPCQNELSPLRLETVLETDLGGLSTSGFVAPELIHFSSFDGRQIPGLFYHATTVPGQPQAAIVDVHGGPEAQSRPSFDPITQNLVQSGISVLKPNIRGSLGYGRSYVDADNLEKRPDALQDVACSAEFLKKVGIDPQRIGIMGGSYGGYVTLAALAFDPQHWAAGVDRVGMSNLETFMQNTGAWRKDNRAAEYGDPERDQELLHSLSPIHKVDQIKAPLMIIQGSNDPRVPHSEADQMVEALKKSGRQVDYLLFQDEGHGLKKPDNQLKGYTAQAQFLEKHLLEG